MNKEKQIEEMAKLACTCFDGNCKGCPFDFYPPCPPKASAKRIYNAGYRKQSEGEWIWTESGQEDYEQYWVCSCCHEKDYFEDKFCPECGAKMKGGAE